MESARSKAVAASPMEQTRAVNDAVARQDYAAIAERLHPDAVWEHNLGVGSLEEGVYRGRDAIVRLFERMVEPWEYLRPEPEEVRELDDGTVLIRGTLRAKHRASTSEVLAPYEQHLEIRDGLMVKGRMHTGLADAQTRQEET